VADLLAQHWAAVQEIVAAMRALLNTIGRLHSIETELALFTLTNHSPNGLKAAGLSGSKASGTRCAIGSPSPSRLTTTA
jgi:hypothetical protein